MAEIPSEFGRRIAEIAADRTSGASDLLGRAVGVLQEALASRVPIRPVARAICEAQPTMAPLWNAALEAVAAEHAPGRFDRFAQRVSRSTASIARLGADYLAGTGETGPIRIVTLSGSRSVLSVLSALHSRRAVHLSCSESRPTLEGRTLAAALAERGLTVTCFADAAIGHALASADAVLVGADAVSANWFMNKSGTRMLAAAAALHGVPVYVVASREKFVDDAVAARLTIRDGAPGEIWADPPSGVAVRNPYFEPTPLDLVTAVISDVGILGAGMVPDVCRSMHDDATLAILAEIGGNAP